MADRAGTLVIGFGPSAFGALLGLLAAGETPEVLSPLGPWPGPCDDPGSSSKSGLARKTRFGSADMYRYPKAAGVTFASPGPLPISAVPGGLSTVWGSNIQVFSGVDLDAWGPAADDMEAAYRTVLGEVPHQGADDALSARFPWPMNFPGSQPLSARVTDALERVRPTPGALIGLGRNATAPVGHGCVACGKCLDGCPEGVIFDAGPKVAALVDSHGLVVHDGLATMIRTIPGGVEVDFVERHSLNLRTVVADRVVLAAGSIASTVLLSNSGLLPRRVLLDDTQVFYAPIVPRQAPGPGLARFTLAQMFVTGDGSAGTPDYHLSLYESDPSFAARAEGMVGPLARLVPGRAYRQLMAAIGFIPAAKSGRIDIERGPDASAVVRTITNPQSAAYVKHALKFAGPALSSLGMHLVAPLAQVSDVGASYHVGHLHASGEDLIDSGTGAVRGTEGVYVVDGAALPHLPTGPVTLTMMANAYRICSAVKDGHHA